MRQHRERAVYGRREVASSAARVLRQGWRITDIVQNHATQLLSIVRWMSQRSCRGLYPPREVRRSRSAADHAANILRATHADHRRAGRAGLREEPGVPPLADGDLRRATDRHRSGGAGRAFYIRTGKRLPGVSRDRVKFPAAVWLFPPRGGAECIEYRV